MHIKKEFAKWATGYSGCDGGDIGSLTSPSTWVCGIEWGGDDLSYDWLKKELERQADSDFFGGYDTEEANTGCCFNLNVTKLLAAIDGLQVTEYKKFSMDIKPFVKGQKGYFKMNLLPLPFKNTSGERLKIWVQIQELTGLSTEDEYKEWCRNNRFRFFRESLKKHKPKLVVCFGKSYKDDFFNAFCGEGTEVINEKIGGRDLYWSRCENTFVTVCPFPACRYGLNSNKLLQDFGVRIRDILNNS